MPDTVHAYLPIDRRVALRSGVSLPTEVWGTVLEADLSGFTALTESLASRFGEQRGAAELTRRLNILYDGLLRQVHHFGGTVLGFSGDAFTCWLDGDDGMRSVACAEALQAWMADHADEVADDEMPAPRLKVALATGGTRRFLVGDPDVQLLEGLAGALVDELAAAEHEAGPGEIVLAPSTSDSLGSRVRTGDRGVLVGTVGSVVPAPWPALPDDASDVETARPWLLPAVHERLRAGEGDFVAELRPATAVFVRFLGIAFESDPDALGHLDRFVRAVQGILSGYEGTLVQLTIGDKGSYLYAAMGAPVAHEDDTLRALLAALELRDLQAATGPVREVSIGVAAGRLRSGAYGGTERRTYGVLGDAVNLAARLMQAAGPGEIVVTGDIEERHRPGFAWAPLPDLTVKGKAAPVHASRLLRRQATSPPRHRPTGELVGRRDERDQLLSLLDETTAGRGRVVAVCAEAGVGKTRLVGELLRAARDRGIPAYEGECPSFGANSAYLAWRTIWQRLLDVDEGDPVARLEVQLGRGGDVLVPRLPLLGPLLGRPIPDNALTRNLDAKVRKTSLEATAAAWVRATTTEPTVVVIEDCHWIDGLSEDLLQVIGRTITELPVLLVLTLRPRDVAEGGPLAVARQPHYREIPLGPLSDGEVATLIRDRIGAAQLPAGPTDEVRRLATRAEGNPFYAGELAQYVVELGPAALEPSRLAELPTSLQSLVLSRIDRLGERPRATLKVASAVGRSFEVALLAPVHRELGTTTEVEDHAAVLQARDFVVPGGPNAYSFKHAITHEVTYSTIVEEVRASLHGRIGRVIEALASEVEEQLDVLAYHFGRGDDEVRRRRYVLAAGKAAQARYDNRAAIDHYRNVLPLLSGEQESEVLLDLGRALGLLGRWDEAAAAFDAAATGATGRGDRKGEAWAAIEQGELLRKQGRYDEAAARFSEAERTLQAVGDATGVAEVLHLAGTLAAQQGDTDRARRNYTQSLDLRRGLDDRRGIARSLNGLGVVAEYEGRLAAAATYYEEALQVLQELGDTWGVAALTNNAGMVMLIQGDPTGARPLFVRAVALQREIGDPQMLANFLSNLGDAARELDDLGEAARCYRESLALSDELGERWLLAYLLEDVAMLAAAAGTDAEAVSPAPVLAAAARQLRNEIGAPLPRESQHRLDERLRPAVRLLARARYGVLSAEGAALTLQQAVEMADEVLENLAP